MKVLVHPQSGLLCGTTLRIEKKHVFENNTFQYVFVNMDLFGYHIAEPVINLHPGPHRIMVGTLNA